MAFRNKGPIAHMKDVHGKKRYVSGNFSIKLRVNFHSSSNYFFMKWYSFFTDALSANLFAVRKWVFGKETHNSK